MHVVALANDRSAGAAYRAELPMRALAERGHRAEFIAWDQRDAPPPLETLSKADVVHMWRLFRAPARRLATALKEAGVGVVFDNDDDMTRVPKGSPAYAEMRAAREQVAKELGAMLRLADLVTTTCGELAGRLRRLGGGDVRVVENYTEAGFLRERRPSGNEVVVGWIAGMEHRGDLRDLRLRRALQGLLDAQPHVRVVSVGVDLGVRSDRYAHHAFVPFPELPDMIARFDVGLAPIANVSFNRVRSNVKVKEYAAAGVPWLASPIGPYKEMGEEQGGRLVADYSWAEALAEVVTDDAARARLAERSAAWGRTQTVTCNAQEWEAVFAEAAARAGRSVDGLTDRSRNGGEAAGDGARAGAARAGAPTVPAPERPAPAAAVPAPARRGLFRRRRAG
jgi:glycosyltransferase involved in cell wall biosynthesis